MIDADTLAEIEDFASTKGGLDETWISKRTILTLIREIRELQSDRASVKRFLDANLARGRRDMERDIHPGGVEGSREATFGQQREEHAT